MNAERLLQSLTLAGVVAICGYLFQIEHRLTKIESSICHTRSQQQ
jgi:hypothetical protein